MALSFKQTTSHKKAVLSLFKSMVKAIKKLQKIDDANVRTVPHRDLLDAVNWEARKAAIDKRRYTKNLLFEMIHIAKEEIVRAGWNNSGLSIRNKLVEGIEAVEILEAASLNDAAAWDELVMFFVEKRMERYREEDMRGQERMRRRMKTTKARTNALSSDSGGRSRVLKETGGLSFEGRMRQIRHELSESKQFSDRLLRRYLKKLQMEHRVPIPHLLPGTKSQLVLPLDESFSTSLAIPGSTCHSAMYLAYDREYIDAIVKPGLEHDINRFYYVEKLKSLVEEKGPFNVKIQITDAGPFSIPYIRMPYLRIGPLKEVALDIKRLMRLIRLISVWNSTKDSKSITEPKFADGSFSLKGSKGFGKEERIYPKHFYTELAQAEGTWEYILNLHTDEEKQNNLAEYIEQWQAPIDEATNVLQDDMARYYTRYNALKSPHSPLIKQQKLLQNKMFDHYDKQQEKFRAITQVINQENLFKHSELINLDDKVTKPFTEYLGNNKLKSSPKKYRGIPKLERLGMGKNLGDYLDDFGFHYFKWGMRYDKGLDLNRRE